MNGAESLLKSLHSAGVEVCFANPGTSEMQFVDALDRTGLMRCVLGLFEGVVSGAADGYARMAKKPAATLLHLAPGLANAGANLHNARKARTPMLNIVGDHARRHLRYEAPLTADVPGTAAAFSDWVRTVQSTETIAGDAMDALAAAWGHPGQISTLIVPADIGWEPVSGVEPVDRAKARAPRKIDQDMLRRAASSLGPDAVILCGGNVLESPESMALLAGIASSPIPTGRVFCSLRTVRPYHLPISIRTGRRRSKLWPILSAPKQLRPEPPRGVSHPQPGRWTIRIFRRPSPPPCPRTPLLSTNV